MPRIEITCDSRRADEVVEALRAAGVTGQIQTLVSLPQSTITAEHDDPDQIFQDHRVRHAIARAQLDHP